MYETRKAGVLLKLNDWLKVTYVGGALGSYILLTARKIVSTPYSKGLVLASEGESESEEIGTRGSGLIVNTLLRLKSI